MQCPHCKVESSVFQALDAVSYRPILENWKIDRPPLVQPGLFFCISCEGRVRIDAQRRIIVKVDTVPVYDDVVELIVRQCRASHNETIDEYDLLELQDRHYRGLNRLSTGAEVVSSVIEQRP